MNPRDEWKRVRDAIGDANLSLAELISALNPKPPPDIKNPFEDLFGGKNPFADKPKSP